MIFFGLSLIAPPNATTMLALVALSLLSCMRYFPDSRAGPSLWNGLIHIPSEPITNVLSHLEK